MIELRTTKISVPRRSCYDLEEMINDIKINGVQKPLIVKKSAHRYLLIDGLRRLRACEFLGYTRIPVTINE